MTAPLDPVSKRRSLLAVSLIFVAALAVSVFLRGREPAPKLELTPVMAAVLNDPGSPRVGPSNASVTIVVFTDYQCGVCRKSDPALRRLIASDPDVRVIFKDWPIFGPVSRTAAMAALVADRQGKYLALHEALMTAPGRLDEARIRQIAADVGVDLARAAPEFAPAVLDGQLRRHALQAFSLGLEGTPGYLVGARLVKGGLDDAALKRAVARARREGPPS